MRLECGIMGMVVQGVVQNGVVVPNEPLTVPEGTQVSIEIAATVGDQPPNHPSVRQGGWLKGNVKIAADFDELPDDLRDAFGMN